MVLEGRLSNATHHAPQRVWTARVDRARGFRRIQCPSPAGCRETRVSQTPIRIPQVLISWDTKTGRARSKPVTVSQVDSRQPYASRPNAIGDPHKLCHACVSFTRVLTTIHVEPCTPIQLTHVRSIDVAIAFQVG